MTLNQGMTESNEAPVSPTGMPHIPGHRHSDVSGGWLRAATFGAVDTLLADIDQDPPVGADILRAVR